MGAKISGAGLGGNVIVLTQKPHIPLLEKALLQAGAAACYLTEVST
jgi:mevalonate kinase